MPRQMYSKFMFLFFIRYVRNRIDHWCTVEPGNPNPRVHCSSGKLGKASFPTGTVDPRVGISLSPLNTNDGFFFLCNTSLYKKEKILMRTIIMCNAVASAVFFPYFKKTFRLSKERTCFLK